VEIAGFLGAAARGHVEDSGARAADDAAAANQDTIGTKRRRSTWTSR
jgi:hypothetical protein